MLVGHGRIHQERSLKWRRIVANRTGSFRMAFSSNSVGSAGTLTDCLWSKPIWYPGLARTWMAEQASIPFFRLFSFLSARLRTATGSPDSICNRIWVTSFISGLYMRESNVGEKFHCGAWTSQVAGMHLVSTSCFRLSRRLFDI